MQSLKYGKSEKNLSLELISKYILPAFGTQPQRNMADGLSGKQPSYITREGKTKACAWKNYQHFYKLHETERNRLNNLWQAHPDCGVSTLLGFNGSIHIHGIDFDSKHFTSLEQTIDELFSRHPILKTCHRFNTPRGGLRIIFGTLNQLKGFGSNSGFALKPYGARCGELLTKNGGHTLMPGCDGYHWVNFPEEIITIFNPEEIFYPLQKRPQKPSQQKTVLNSKWEDYLNNFQWSVRPVPLEVACAPDHRDLIKSGVRIGSRDNTAIALALDLIGAYEYLESVNQAVEGTPQDLLREFCDNCQPPLEDNDFERIIESARKHDSNYAHRSTLTPSQIKGCVAGYFWRNSDKPAKQFNVIDIKSKTPKTTEQLLNELLDDLINQELSGSKLKTKITAYASEFKRSYKEIFDLYQSKLSDLEFEDNSKEIKSSVENFLKVKNTDIKIEQYLHPHLAEPLKKLSKYLGVNQFVLLTNFLTVSASLIPVNTRLELIAATDFYAHPILYSGICAPSGSNKSGGLNLFLKPLKELQSEEDRKYNEALADYKEELKLWKSDKKGYDEPNEPPPPREYFVTDSTSEACARIQNNQPNNGFLGYFDELAELLGQANRYRSGKGSDIQKLLRGRDGSGIKINRASGLRISCPRSGYSILGAIQPHVLKKLMGDFSDGNGFWARFIWASQEIRTRPFPDDVPRINVSELLKDVYQRLGEIDETFILNPQAKQNYKLWFEYTEYLKVSETKPALRSVISKSQRLVGEICLILHCVNSAYAGTVPEKQVDGYTMQAAIDLTKRYIEQIKLIQAEGDDQQSQSLAYSKIISLSQRKGWLKGRDVSTGIWSYRSKSNSEIRSIFRELVELGYGKTRNKGTRLQWHHNPDDDDGPTPNKDTSPPPGKSKSDDVDEELMMNSTGTSSIPENVENKEIRPGVNQKSDDVDDELMMNSTGTSSIPESIGTKDTQATKIQKLMMSTGTSSIPESIDITLSQLGKNQKSDDVDDENLRRSKNYFDKTNGLPNLKSDDAPSSIPHQTSSVNFELDLPTSKFDDLKNISTKTSSTSSLLQKQQGSKVDTAINTDDDNLPMSIITFSKNNGCDEDGISDTETDDVPSSNIINSSSNIITFSKNNGCDEDGISDTETDDVPSSIHHQLSSVNSDNDDGNDSSRKDRPTSQPSNLDGFPLNPKEAARIDWEDAKVIVDEDKLDLFRKPQLNLPDWQPSKKILDYHDALKIYLDIETTGGLDPNTGRVIAVGFMFDVGDRTESMLITYEDEKDILVETIGVLRLTKADILIGHNLHNFDIPYLARRCEINAIKHPFKKSNRVTRVTASSFHGKPLEITQWNIRGLDIIDTFVQACIYDKSAAVLPNYRLKDVARAIGVRDEKRLELDHNQITQHWESGEVEPILKYLEYDLIDTKGLADYFIPVVWYQKFIVPDISLQYLSVASPALKWQKLAESFYSKSYRPQTDEKLRYEGALTHCNPGLYRDAYKIDVSSMYPSILLTYELASDKDTEAHLLRVMRYLMNHRLELKRKYKETGVGSFDQQQGALKILINGGYGFFGTGGYGFNDMKVAALVTAYGRKILKLMMSVLSNLGVTIIETDTDGLICCGGNPLQALEAVQAQLPEGIKIDLDFDNTHIYVPKRKSYLLFGEEKIKRVGLFRTTIYFIGS